MADIFIWMEMPNSCVECSLTGLPVAVSILGASCPWCREVIDPKVNLRTARHEDCPLHELPEHGDLIDVSKISLQEYEQAAHDALHNGKGSILYDCGVLAGARAITQFVRRQPVIVPKSKEENE